MLVARGLGKSYRGVEVLRGVDLELKPGRVLGLVGHNGAGKSTTIKMLAGLVEPSAGSVLLDGEPTTRPHVRARLGYLPEESPLYDEQTPLALLAFFGSLYDLPRSESLRRGRDLLHRLGLEERQWKKPLGRMSKGMRRKVAVARALLHEPDVLILDEPASGLDPGTADDLGLLIREQADAGRAVLLSAHNLPQVEEVCDAIVVLHRGDLVAQGTLQELRARWGQTVYHVRATVAFGGSAPRGPIHWADLDSMEEVEGALAQVRRAGGSVLEVDSAPPRLEEILRRVTED